MTLWLLEAGKVRLVYQQLGEKMAMAKNTAS
jgi:hypothetical protein